MESMPGYLVYLLIAWGVIAAVFVILWIWRNLLDGHEDDQIFIDSAGDHMAREQRELVARINSLSKPLFMSGILAGALLLVIAGLWLWQGLKNF